MRGIDYYLIKLDESEDSLFKRKYGSLEYYIPFTMKEDKGVFPQIGEVVGLKKGNPLGLEVGDAVLTHHFIREKPVRDNIYYELDENIYARFKDDKVEMLGDRVMINRIEEHNEHNGILLSASPTAIPDKCVIKHNSPKSQVQEGQTVGVLENRFYTMKAKGKEFTMIDEPRSIMYYEDGDKMVPVNSWVMIEYIQDESRELLYGLDRIKGLPTGKVIRTPQVQIEQEILCARTGSAHKIEEGMEVYFQKRPDRRKIEDGKEYYFCRIEEYDEVKLIK